MGAHLEKYVVPVVPVAAGIAFVLWGGLVPLGALSGVVLGACAMLLVGWLFIPEERSTAVLRMAMYIGSALIGGAVFFEFWKMWAWYVAGSGWGVVPEIVRAVATVQARLEGALAVTPWVAGALVFFGLYFAFAVMTGFLASLGDGEEGKKWSELGLFGKTRLMSRRVMKMMSDGGDLILGSKYVVPAVPVSAGIGFVIWGGLVPLGALSAVVLGACAMLLVGWLFIPEERSTAVLRMAMYVGASLIGGAVFFEFWKMWSGYVAGSGWGVVLEIVRAVATVQARLEGALAVTPWVAGALVFFGLYFAFAVLMGFLTSLGEGEEGKRRSTSELFGKSELMGKRQMRKMSRDGGLILGAMENGSKAELVTYPLEGAAMTVALPRTGKTQLIAGNLLAPKKAGLRQGSMIILDPRGEVYCVVAKRRHEMGRNVVLVDPFGVVGSHVAEFGDALEVPTVESVRLNPLDLIRSSDDGVGDIRVLLDGLLTPPAKGGADNAQHFYQSARAILGGMLAWTKWMHGDPDRRASPFRTVRTFMTTSGPTEENMKNRILKDPSIGWGLPFDAIQRMEKVGIAEGGSNFSTIANQLDWLLMPALHETTLRSSFDPMVLADGETDLFVVVPENQVDGARSWLRLWIVIANMVAERKLDHAGMTIIIDEMPKLGYLKPVMDSVTMAAGKGIRYWFFTQTISALDEAYKRENREVLMDLVEVLQILGFPRTNPEFADRVSKMIGHATFVNQSRNSTGTVAGGEILMREQSHQSGVNRALVKERLMTAEDLMMLPAEEQIVLTNSKTVGREAMRLFRTAYWLRDDMKGLAAANPYVLRKDRDRLAA